ncbi:hypothetical protein C1H76_8498 [Elsinoe australis]|uniref:EH domain-containing protein n=1 Tax=Elsinoe australis TaxID=40998 RepID=A0A4V6DT51_9PEZI|nr:hypothetical protein C1H76_8498 [Elsinoe australis]
MTSPRQRPGRPTPPRTSHEAALVGALTAFAKSPSTSPGHQRRPAPSPNTANQLTRPQAKPLDLSVSAQNTPAKQSPPSGSPGKPIRHDSGAAPTAKEHGKEARIAKQTSPERRQPVGQDTVKPKVQKKPKPLQLAAHAVPAPSSARTAPMPSIDAAMQKGGSEETRTPSASALVQMFEKQGTRTTSVNMDTPLQSPKPIRKSLVLNQDDHTVSSQVKPRQVSTSSEASLPDNPPLSGKSRLTDLSSPNSFRSARDSFSPLAERKESITGKPAIPPPRRPSKAPPPLQTKPDLSPPHKDVPHSAPIPIKQVQLGPYTQPSAATSTASIQATYNALHPRKTTALRTGDSLANAIVASSLASSRNPSPAKFPQSESLRSHHSLFTRTPSPHKRKPASAGGMMRHTLRKETPSSADEDNLSDDPYYKHKKKRHIRKHANKYHEGDRKRWRNVVTEKERGRYEGVWAANKGLLLDLKPSDRGGRNEKQAHGKAGSWMDDTGFDMDGLGPLQGDEAPSTNDKDKDYVHAFVARDIWSRSRLPTHVLEEIWGLVDGERRAALSREEFVVGMWLVDQRLKGRKLPVKVSDSVWNSVRFLKGIKVRPVKERVVKGKK